MTDKLYRIPLNLIPGKNIKAEKVLDNYHATNDLGATSVRITIEDDSHDPTGIVLTRNQALVLVDRIKAIFE